MLEVFLIVSAVANIVGGVVLFFTYRKLKDNLPPF